VGNATAATSVPRGGRNPVEVDSARSPGGEREDPEGANVRRAISSVSGETEIGREMLSVGSKAPRSIQAWEGSRSTQVDEEPPPQQRIPTRKSEGSGQDGIAARWRMETLRGRQRRRSRGPGNRYRSMDGQTLKTEPSKCLWGGTNPQAGGGFARREVVKTWGRAAQGLESLTSGHTGDGAVRETNPREVLGLTPSDTSGHTLKSTEAHERINRCLHKASCLRGEGLEDVETSVGST
jgi:hypothetical protein